MLRRTMYPLLAILFVGLPRSASADFKWLDSAWTVTPSISELFPPYSDAKASFVGGADDILTATLKAFAENPPGPGGPTASARLNIARSFEIVDNDTTVTLGVLSRGWLSIGPVIGATYSELEFSLGIEGANGILVSHHYNGPRQINEVIESAGLLQAGQTYTVRGFIVLSATSMSGGPSASGEATVRVRLRPSPVPEPGSAVLLALGAGAILGGIWSPRRPGAQRLRPHSR